MRFAGKSVIVTGGAAGIGAASARLFAAEGARVVIADLDPAGGALAAELCGQGREAAFIRADVADARDAESLVALAVRRYGRLDVLHNNAGVLVIGDVTSLSEADWDRCMDTNLKSIFLVSRHAVPALRQSGGGAIVNTASVAGKAGGRGYSVYCASKAGILLLTQCRYGATFHGRDWPTSWTTCPGMQKPATARTGAGFADFGGASRIRTADLWIMIPSL